MAWEHQFGTKSLREIRTTHPDLQEMAFTALQASLVDFAVVDGVRTKMEQKALVAAGASTTMDSRHLYSGQPLTAKALDCVPYINGKVRWEWPPIYQMVCGWHAACVLHKIDLRWGGVWDRTLLELDPISVDAEHLEHEVAAYVRRREGKRVFLDGPHFELLRDEYP